jgi:hypothetical protein
MAKKQTRRSISVSRTTYERLKAFCETNNISMSQLVETRVNDFLGAGEMDPVAHAPTSSIMSGMSGTSGTSGTSGMSGMSGMSSGSSMPIMPSPVTTAFRPLVQRPPAVTTAPIKPIEARPLAAPLPAPVAPSAPPVASPVPMTSVAARFAVDPPPPIIKPRQDTAAPKPAEKRPDQIFTF